MNISMYEFRADDAFRFASFIGIPTRKEGNELTFKQCPYCRSTKDKNTFSINLETGAYNCFRAKCKAHGNMITLARDFNFSLGRDVDEYISPRRQFRELEQPKEPIIPKPKALEYLKHRGISRGTAEKYQITVRSDNDSVLVIPFFSPDGRLEFIKYRNTAFKKGQKGSKEYTEKNTKPILFGMDHATDTEKPLVITEGQMDALALAEAGIPNPVSVPTGANGMTWVPYCWDWMHRFHEVIVFGDHENGKITLVDELMVRLGDSMRVLVVRAEDYMGHKDANDILQLNGPEQLRVCVRNAEPAPISEVIDIADVKTVDISKVPKVLTGIWPIDKTLFGGIPCGGVTLITGKPGEGKSTFASQVLVRAMMQNYRCFAYSGELDNGVFKSWLLFQLAGNHVVTSADSFGNMDYGISEQNEKLINEWLRDRLYLRDNRSLDAGTRTRLIDLCKKMIVQQGIRVILLDNLMTAMFGEPRAGTNENIWQTDFLTALASMALQYNVAIILVAHKRKNRAANGNENDEIAGSGNIANLATVVISYAKSDKLDPSERYISVSKNRMTGKTIFDVKTSFDEKSRRIYGMGDDVGFEVGWEVDKFVPADDDLIFK